MVTPPPTRHRLRLVPGAWQSLPRVAGAVTSIDMDEVNLALARNTARKRA
jgi:hypothetical protein